MSGEGEYNEEVEVIQPDTEGKIKPDKEGKFPEVVPKHQYIGVKESLGKKLDAEKQKVASLEEQLKKAVKQEDFDKIKGELEEAKTKFQTASDELKGVKEKSIAEKKEFLKSKGIPEEEVNQMSEDALTGAVKVLERQKPKLDLGGGGGGSGELKGSPMELARKAYS